MQGVANSREYILVWDSTMSNPNGDILNDNRPRMDETTNFLEVSDFRIKRYIRDELISMGENVLVQITYNEKGKVKTCAKRIEEIKKESGLKKDDELIKYILDNYIDARLFGYVITSPKKNLTGPLQVTWSRSLNRCIIDEKQGTGSYASGEGKDQATIWTSYICPYALFKTYMAFNQNTALKNEVPTTEDDINKFIEALLNGMRNYRSSSKNQMPRLLIEVVYNNNKLDGELDCITINKDIEDEDLRSISQTSVDISKLNDYYRHRKDDIKKVNLYVHKSVSLDNLDNTLGFNIKTI